MKLRTIQPVVLGSLIFAMFVAATGGNAQASKEWPQFRGLNRDGISSETGLLKTWPATGPKVVWRVPVGDGYSSMAVTGGRLYTMEAKGDDEFVVCLDAPTGKEIWRVRSDVNFMNDQGNGPRATPTVENGIVYALGAQAKLYALDAKDGKKIWRKDLQKELGAKLPIWGYASSPLVEGNLLVVPVGGSEQNAIVAFDKGNGSIIWKSQTDEPGYSSPIAITVNGLRQIIAFSGTALYSLSPKDGTMLWRYPWKTDWFVNAATPIFIPDDKLFISTSYDHGGALLRVKVIGDKASVEEVYLTKEMKNHFNSSVLYEGHLYGFDNSVLKCLDAATGEEKWSKSGMGKGSLILADGHLIVLSERGLLALVEATPVEYREKASAQVLQGKCWTHPSLSNGKLYLRNQKELVCLDVTGNA
jgi:outer membrane protein assembly factor BamB